VIEGGVVYYVRADHIGRPVFATNSSGAKVWEVSYLPFGGVRVATGLPIEARFPGQWFQSESGLHQNWMRDYDPTTGRYLQADPLGLVDGARVYGYALQNPVVHADPRGEEVADLLNSTFGRKALGTAAAASIGDGPFPIGDAIGLCIVGAAVLYCAADGYYCTADDDADCDQEWDDAYDMCERELSKPNPARGITGGYRTLGECARGLVSERCVGNKVEY
jgi:RHS repeat-associated protein